MATKREAGGKSEWESWLVVLTCTSVPIILALFFFYKWNTQNADFQRQTSQFVQRQNTVLAYDAMEISRDVSRLLDGAAHDATLAAAVHDRKEAVVAFLAGRVSPITLGRSESGQVKTEEKPIYREAVIIDAAGNEKWRVVNGKSAPLRKLSQCSVTSLCDAKLRESLTKLAVGKIHYGKLLRLYTPQAPDFEPADEESGLSVGVRTKAGAVILMIDYVHLKEIRNYPVFPYRRFPNQMLAYEEGNYAYLVDWEGDFLTHPKYWHAMGIDPNTGGYVSPVRQDSDQGTHPLNVLAYQGEKLKAYFERLRTRSFRQKSVDIFQAPNLKGTNRVLSVAPVLLHQGQFAETGIFGHVIVGCSVDYFEEPKEQYVPYY
jgi:hypothetical protein